MAEVSSEARLDGRELLRYTWPPLLGSLGGIVVGFTDSMLISYYSTSALAGVSLGAAFYELPVNILMGALMAHRILAPRVAKMRDIEGLRTVLRLLAPIAAIFSLGLIGAAVLFLQMASAPSWVASLGYTAARAPSLVAETISTALVITLVSWGRNRMPFLVFLVSAPANLLFDGVLVYGVGPVPELGAAGAGIGSSLAVILPLPLLLHALYRFQPLRISRAELHEYPAATDVYQDWVHLAWPAVGSAVVDYTGNLLFTAIIAGSGTAALAGLRFGLQLHTVMFVIVSSMSSASLYVGGRRIEEDRAWPVRSKRSVRLLFGRVGVVLGLAIIGGGLLVASLVSPDPEVVINFMVSVVAVGFLSPVAAAAYGEVTLLRWMKRTDMEFKANGIAVWFAQIPLAVVLQIVFGGLFPIAGLLAYWTVRCLISRLEVSKIAIVE